jgi:hypothetical protein
MDIYHTGKEDASDDHKFINERLLEVALPPEPTDGSTLTLEDCLEAYFNNRIEVKRHLERRNTVSSTRSVDSMSISKGFTAHIEEIETTPTLSPVQSNSPQVERPSPWTSVSDTSETMPRRGITRRDSIVQERFIPDPTDVTANNQPSSGSDPQQRRGIFRKEVMMPAWQFFSLIRTFPPFLAQGGIKLTSMSVQHGTRRIHPQTMLKLQHTLLPSDPFLACV